MINYKDYDLIWKEEEIIGYKEDIIRFLIDRVVDFIKNGFERNVIDNELDRLEIVKNSKYDNTDLIELINNDEEKSHISTKPIAKVKVLIPYGNGFSFKDVAKYLV